jgi:hypothetical protein
MNYTLRDENGITYINIETPGPYGVICFGYDNNNAVFMAALADKGIEVFIQLLVYDPNTAYTTFTAGYGDGL